MRYNSPTIQLLVLAAVLLLTTALRRLLTTYLVDDVPTDMNLVYDSYWPTSLVACLSGFIGIFLVNLAGARCILLFYSFTSIILFASIVSRYQSGSSVFYKVATILDSLGYDLGRVATLVLVLAYPSERWKARCLALFLLMEYFSMTFGDLISMREYHNEQKRLHVAIAGLVITCLSPFVAMAIAPSHKVVRDNGVYLVARKTTFAEELCGTRAIFKNKYMLLLLPYMFSYPFLFGAANVPFPTILAIICYDMGKIFIVLMSLTLDIPWASRRTRGLVSLVMLTVFCVTSIAVTIAMRLMPIHMEGIDPKWTLSEVNDYIFDGITKRYNGLLLTSYFFAGIASSFVELFGFWIIGTLTNDIKTSGRFVGTFHSAMSIGGMVGYQMVTNIPHKYTTSNVPTYISSGLTLVSFILVYFIVRRLADTNDWTLGIIASNEAGRNSSSEQSTVATTVVADVKYQHMDEDAQP
ncbi:hypothetical protein GGF46_004104 [Coemansia sp. RSA 552]|nr:hypothetical protein GGF46_004104 [Coemansia sp. RSA 552]